MTNKVEAYNGFAAWLRFGNGGVIAENDPAEQEKMIKSEGWEPAPGYPITAEDIAQLSPYLTEHIGRFGMYATDVLKLRPVAFNPELPGIDFDALAGAA